jgi:hypothetical protein
MHDVVNQICVALDETAAKVTGTLVFQNTLRDSWGWQFPPLTPADLAGLATRLADRIRAADVDELDSATIANLAPFAGRLRAMGPDTIPNMAGNFQAVSAYFETLDVLEKALVPALSMVIIDDARLYPAKMATRLRSLNRTIENIGADEAKLLQNVKEINQAYAAAKALPATLQDLEEARISLEEMRVKIEKIHEDATKTEGKIEATESSASDELAKIRLQAAEADDLIKKCEDAYQITTTKGLAAAFDQRARALNISMFAWVFGLLVSLYFGARFGSSRIEVLSTLLADTHPDWGAVVLHIVLTGFAVGGPIWFGWLSTKQIGQRFRLAEDYAYKASVAKAYEGYRKQAASLVDPQFTARLFGTALTRLEEAPLRLIEKDAHGSPLGDFFSSDLIQRAISTVPEFQQQAVDLARKALDTAAAIAAPGRVAAPSTAKTEPSKDS